MWIVPKTHCQNATYKACQLPSWRMPAFPWTLSNEPIYQRIIVRSLVWYVFLLLNDNIDVDVKCKLFNNNKCQMLSFLHVGIQTIFGANSSLYGREYIFWCMGIYFLMHGKIFSDAWECIFWCMGIYFLMYGNLFFGA